MKRLLTLIALSALTCLCLSEAAAITPEAQQKVVTAASKNLVEIGLSYKGDEIHFFGVNPVPGSDLIIRLTAEKSEEVKLSVKGRVGPFWMTVKQYDVTGAPFMYKIHSNKPVDQIISAETAQELELGYDAIRPKVVKSMHLARGEASPDDPKTVFDGLVKIKEKSNLYNVISDPKRLEVTEGKLFKHYFRFPPAATEGRYLVESFAFQNGQLVGYGKDVIQIQKVGLEAWLTDISQNHPIFFGIMAVIVALAAGLGVGMIFRKGGHH